MDGYPVLPYVKPYRLSIGSLFTISSRRFMKALKAKGISRDSLPYKAPFQPWGSYFAFVSTAIITIFKGFDTFMPFNVPNFITYASFFSLKNWLLCFVPVGATLRSLSSSCYGLGTRSSTGQNCTSHMRWISLRESPWSKRKKGGTTLRKPQRGRKQDCKGCGILCDPQSPQQLYFADKNKDIPL